jgi:hypothetical protein
MKTYEVNFSAIMKHYNNDFTVYTKQKKIHI